MLKKLFSVSYIAWDAYQELIGNRELWNFIDWNCKKSLKNIQREV